MRRSGAGQANRLLATLVVAGCVAACIERGTVSGKAPERITRELPENAPVAKKPLDELYKEHEDKSDAGDPKVEKTDPAEMRIGVDATHVFHRASCVLLKDVPVAQQVRFTSRWDALDGGYRPCDECKAAR
jgi:hypothetical protein